MNTLLAILLIIFISTLIQSIFSFGGALIALPLLAFFVEVRYATPLMTMLSASIAVAVVVRNWRDVEFMNAWRLIMSSFIGIPLGIMFLSGVDDTVVRFVLGVTVLVFATVNLISVGKIRLLHPNYAFGFGFVSGLFGGAYNISGPPVVLYGSLSNWSPNRFRATIQSYALFTNIFAIIGHYWAANITPQVVTIYLYALPVMIVTIWLGNKIHQCIPGEHYTKYVNILLSVLGINLLLSIVM